MKKLKIGYACLAIDVPNTTIKSCIMKNATKARLTELIVHNLTSLENIIDYNIKNHIKLFRISSAIIPFGSSPVNSIPWWDIFSDKFYVIGEKIRQSGMRVSMHPGQYTILNSPDKDVVMRAMEDLNYHARVLDSLGVDEKNKIVLHIGGVYQDKKLSVKRFILHYNHLSDAVKNRLIIENDDKAYHIQDVIKIGALIKAPVVFDNLHHAVNPCDDQMDMYDWIDTCSKTWRKKDGRQKIHYAQQNPQKRAGAHSETIDTSEFLDFYRGIQRKELDIMLEVKDKNISALKCINAIHK